MSSVGKDVKPLELSHTTAANAKWHNHFGKQFSILN